VAVATAAEVVAAVATAEVVATGSSSVNSAPMDEGEGLRWVLPDPSRTPVICQKNQNSKATINGASPSARDRQALKVVVTFIDVRAELIELGYLRPRR
jgi:hypothetical protein